MYCYAALLCYLTDELLVAIALRIAQMEIAMGNNAIISSALQYIKQGDRIRATTYAHQYPCSGHE